MSLRRTIDWSTAVRDMRAASQVSPFLTAAGRFDLKAIMQAAISEARLLGRGRTGSSLSWQARLSIALKLIWAKAKRAAGAARPAPLRLAA
jgi:hypothetical protein